LGDKHLIAKIVISLYLISVSAKLAYQFWFNIHFCEKTCFCKHQATWPSNGVFTCTLVLCMSLDPVISIGMHWIWNFALRTKDLPMQTLQQVQVVNADATLTKRKLPIVYYQLIHRPIKSTTHTEVTFQFNLPNSTNLNPFCLWEIFSMDAKFTVAYIPFETIGQQ